MSPTSARGLRVAITGAGRGIGLATARALFQAGAEVVIGDVDADAAAAAVHEVGPGTLSSEIDVSDYSSFSAFLRTATQNGPLDVLINNAGIMPIGHFDEKPIEVHRRAVEVNVLGCVNGMHAALPQMIERGSGHILNVASTAGKAPVPGGLTYCGTKAAVLALTETARVEYASTGIHFTSVIPHFTNTELISGTRSTRLVPVAQPEDVARAIVKVIARPKPDVFVPKAMSALLFPQPLIGRRLRDFLNRRLGAYNAFLDFDSASRETYDKRIRRS